MVRGPGGSFQSDAHSMHWQSGSYHGSYHGDMHGRRGGDCEDVFCEEDPEQRVMDERYAYVGRGRGDYTQVTSMQPVAHGQGEFTKEKVVVRSGLRVRLFCILSLCFMVLVVLGLLIFYLNSGPIRGAADVPCTNPLEVESRAMGPLCCQQGFTQFCAVTPRPEEDVVHEKYITHVKTIHVPHVVKVPIPGPPRQVITRKVYVHSHAFDCEKGYGKWEKLWSGAHQRYCCYLKDIACRKKVEVHRHYHVITKVRHVTTPVRIPIPAPPPRVVEHVVNDPIQDPPQVIRVPTPGAPHVVKRIIHEKHVVPVLVKSPPTYHAVPVPVPVTDPGRVIHVKVPLPPQTVVQDKTIYKTKHVKVKRIYDCGAGFQNWIYGWSNAKKHWCCDHEDRGCPGTWHGAGLTKTVTTGVTQHVGHHVYYSHGEYGHGSYDGAHLHHYVYHHGEDVGHGIPAYHPGGEYGHGSYDGAHLHHYVYHHGEDVEHGVPAYHPGGDFSHGGFNGAVHHYVYHHADDVHHDIHDIHGYHPRKK